MEFDPRKEAEPGLDWSGLPLDDIDLHSLPMSGGDFSRCSLSYANFSAADLNDADFSEANLTSADFTEAHLAHAILRGAHLSNAVLDNADLSGADLSATDLTGTSFAGAQLAGATFKGASFNDSDFSESNLTNADLSGARLRGSNPSDAKSLLGANMVGVIGLTMQERAECLTKGAVLVPGATPRVVDASSSDRVLSARGRFKQQGKYKGMVINQLNASWERAVEEFSEHYAASEEFAADAEVAKRMLAGVLNAEALRRGLSELDSDFLDEFLRVADHLVIWLHADGFELRRREGEASTDQTE